MAEEKRFENDEDMWRIFEKRDASADDLFVVAVRSTGIY